MSVITHSLVTEIANKMTARGEQPTATSIFRQAVKKGHYGTHRAVQSCLAMWQLETPETQQATAPLRAAA